MSAQPSMPSGSSGPGQNTGRSIFQFDPAMTSPVGAQPKLTSIKPTVAQPLDLISKHFSDPTLRGEIEACAPILRELLRVPYLTDRFGSPFTVIPERWLTQLEGTQKLRIDPLVKPYLDFLRSNSCPKKYLTTVQDGDVAVVQFPSNNNGWQFDRLLSCRTRLESFCILGSVIKGRYYAPERMVRFSPGDRFFPASVEKGDKITLRDANDKIYAFVAMSEPLTGRLCFMRTDGQEPKEFDMSVWKANTSSNYIVLSPKGSVPPEKLESDHLGFFLFEDRLKLTGEPAHNHSPIFPSEITLEPGDMLMAVLSRSAQTRYESFSKRIINEETFKALKDRPHERRAFLRDPKCFARIAVVAHGDKIVLISREKENGHVQEFKLNDKGTCTITFYSKQAGGYKQEEKIEVPYNEYLTVLESLEEF